ncbi:ABC transporter permease [Brachybacterium fresconis]|uniref:ABC transport system permease protein n=1 Tax=Brachybacterium fresconis TaxID=173363 RepID=A0ABS4YIC2_9MICO|nr:ABC transporter permease [Brachybacterium fresconis]MBP2408162.1 putative ABC transport system permease protein [Brachybacterium fresconis]
MARRTPLKLTPLRRHLAAVLTIALSCAFVTIMVLAGNLMQASLASQASQQYDGADLEISRPLTDEQFSSERPLPAPEIDGAEQTWPLLTNYLQLTSEADGGSAFLSAAMLPPSATAEQALTDGELPSAADEVVLDTAAAEALEVSLGDTVTLAADVSPTGQEASFTVTGLAPTAEGSVFGGTPRVLVTDADAAALLGPTEGTLTETWLASVPEGTDPATVAEAASSGDVTVRSVEEAEQEATSELTQGSAALGMMLGVFVVIALFTSAVVIANTFAVTIAQRTRSLALLRTLGATRGQVRRVVLRESLLVGVLGAVAGLVSGHLLVQAALAVADAVGWLDGLMIVPVGLWSVLLPVIAGVVITLAASLAPMRAATRVAPLQALRPEPPSQRRGLGARGVIGIVAVVLGVLALVGGTLLAVQDAPSLGVLLAMAGGVVSFTGVLLVLIVLTRPLSSLIGRIMGRFGGLPARVASANVARNPRRSAATISALLIGTTLMTMMAVGARTAEETLTSELDSRRPIDLIVSAEEMPEDGVDQIAGIEGMDGAQPAARTDIDVGTTEPMTLYGTSPDAVRETSHRPGMADELEDGIVLLGSERAERFGVTDGQTLRVEGADGSPQELRVQIDANLAMSLVTPATLEQIAGDGATPVVLGDFADPGTAERGDLDAMTLVNTITEQTATSGWSEVSTDVGGAEREMYGQILDILLGIVVALLAVAVVVALVGVANTLSLGVVERTSENALLRALGTTRRQMRAMLGWEGVLLAVVGAVLGIVIGSGYGVLGINALLGSTYPVTVTIPWGQVGLVLLLAILAGGAASVLPGRAAARTAPAAALAGGE